MLFNNKMLNSSYCARNLEKSRLSGGHLGFRKIIEMLMNTVESISCNISSLWFLRVLIQKMKSNLTKYSLYTYKVGLIDCNFSLVH